MRSHAYVVKQQSEVELEQENSIASELTSRRHMRLEREMPAILLMRCPTRRQDAIFRSVL